MAKPFLKWAGGKTQSLIYINELLPKVGLFENYYEPFIGGGAVFFFLEKRIRKAYLSDSNQELMTTYRVVRDNVDELIDKLSTFPVDKDFFEDLKKINPKIADPILVAARMIYLNKTCYNGLYRVNSKNEFNVPYGNYSNPKICDKANLKLCSKALAKAEIQATYFENALRDIPLNSFVYLDPPYLPSGPNFVSYTKNGFYLKDHEKLADIFDTLSERGISALLSNSDVLWVTERYNKYDYFEIMSKRSINSKGDGRGKVSELLIRNYS